MILCFQVLSRMAAKDDISLHTIATSHDIRQGLVARGFKKIPTEHHTMRQYFLSFRATVQHDLKRLYDQRSTTVKSFLSALTSGRRFVISPRPCRCSISQIE